MTPRRVLAVAVAAALLAAAFVVGVQWGAQRGAERPDASSTLDPVAATGAPPAAADTAAPRNAADSMPTPATPAVTHADWPALPPTSANVAAIFDDLAARARRGDASAACRLARDLQRCGTAMMQRQLASDLQDQAARQDATPAPMVDAIANLERQQGRFTEDCDGLQPAHLAQAFEFQRIAAMARPELRPWLALHPALERRDFVNELERWAEYRRLALPWLEDAARAGDATALIALARLHGDLRRNSPPVPPFRLDDPVRAFAYNDALLRLGADYRGLQIGAATARARLDPDALARATDLADTLVRDHPGPRNATAFSVAMTRSFDAVPSPAECESKRPLRENTPFDR